jgi:hypothetical protein
MSQGTKLYCEDCFAVVYRDVRELMTLLLALWTKLLHCERSILHFVTCALKAKHFATDIFPCIYT